MMQRLLLPGLLITVAVACERGRAVDQEHWPLSAPPVQQSIAVTADTVASWARTEQLSVDLNGDGNTETLVVGSDVTIGRNGEPLWEDGHRWGAYVQEGERRTLLYSAFLPHSMAEIGVTSADSDGQRNVLIVERGSQHSRSLVVAYDSVDAARLVSSANYPLERWLRSLTAPRARQSEEAEPVRPAAAPWSRDTLAAAAVPGEFLRAWRAAENRGTCALIAPVQTRAADARPRIAQFSGGWAVAYDVPGQRSAFGVAGTGVEVDSGDTERWPRRRRWSDGSSAGWGPEGGTGPNQLAYLHIAGQRCLYNIWSRVHEGHLRFLLENLRFVVTP